MFVKISRLVDTIVRKMISLVSFLTLIIFKILDSLFGFQSAPGEPGKILVIRLDKIGDFILWLDSAKELRRLFPYKKYHITLLGNLMWCDLANDCHYWDEVWPLDINGFWRNPIYRFQQLKKIRQANFEIAIQPTYSRDFLFGDSVIGTCRAKKRIGSTGDMSNSSTWQKRISDNWYTHLIAAGGSPVMELERNAEFIRGLGGRDFRPRLPKLSVSEEFSLAKGRYYIIFVGASWVGKMWPVSRFAGLVELIARTTNWFGVICGGKGEEGYAKDLMRRSSAELVNLVGKTSLRQLVSVVNNSQFIICNDTCAVHIAAALETPCVCLLGGGHFGRFVPYDLECEDKRFLPRAVYCKMDCFGCNWKCIYEKDLRRPVPCISGITLTQTWNEVREIIREVDVA